MSGYNRKYLNLSYFMANLRNEAIVDSRLVPGHV